MVCTTRLGAQLLIKGDIMTEQVSRNRINWILLAVTVVGLTVAVVCYSYLIASNCGSSGAREFFSSVQAFHTQAGC